MLYQSKMNKAQAAKYREECQNFMVAFTKHLSDSEGKFTFSEIYHGSSNERPATVEVAKNANGVRFHISFIYDDDVNPSFTIEAENGIIEAPEGYNSHRVNNIFSHIGDFEKCTEMSLDEVFSILDYNSDLDLYWK